MHTIRRIVIISLVVCGVLAPLPGGCGEVPAPYGLGIGASSYRDALRVLETRSWTYEEYTRKERIKVAKDDPAQGRNTFLLVRPAGLKGITHILLLFSDESILNAVIVSVKEAYFQVLSEVLDGKYEPVRKHLFGDGFSSDFPYILWQRGDCYIELQKRGGSLVRVVYMEKLYYENVRDFFTKPLTPYRPTQVHRPWMDEL